MKKTIVCLIILLFVGTSLSPTILGLVEETPVVINKIKTEPENFNFKEQKQLQPIEEIRKFYNIINEKQLFNKNLENPIFCSGYWDYTIKGYVTDKTTNDPIEDASILLIWIGKHLSFERDTTTTDATGYYEINLENIFYGEIIYFVRAEGYYSNYDILHLYDKQEKWINVSLESGAPAKNSVVNGYVYNADNGDPIEGAIVDINWGDDNGHGDWLYAVTDSTGFYSLNVPAGEVMPWVYAENYYENYKQEQEIGNGKTLEVNIHLYPRYPDTAMIYGYVTEEQSGDPIENVLVELMSDNFEMLHYDWNYTFTDATGYYEIMVAESDFQIEAFTYFHARAFSHHDHINEGETYEWDTSLYEIPPQTATVTGYITDLYTSDPIKNTYIGCHWDDELGNYFSKYTVSDNLGFYEFNIAPGELFIYAHVSDYFPYQLDGYVIEEYETFLLDISLEPFPLKNSMIKGFITSNKTIPIPIKGAIIAANCMNDIGEYIGGGVVESDKLGNYQISVPAGNVRLNIHADGHYYTDTEYIPIEEGEILRIDFSVNPVELDVAVEKPIRGIYRNNQLLFRFIFPIILGDIDIDVNGSEKLYEVEFYIDGKFKQADRVMPFTYPWNDGSFGFHKITLVFNGAYDKVESKNIRVLKLS